MRFRLHAGVAVVALGEGQQLRAERDSTIGRNTALSTTLTSAGDWFVTRLARATLNKLFGGEDLLAQLFTGPGEVLLADPVFPGKVMEIELADDGLVMKRGAWLASDTDVVLTTTIDTAAAVVVKTVQGQMGESMLLQAKRNSGSSGEGGRVFITSFGTIHAVELAEGETYRADNGNLLAWTTASSSRGGSKSTTLGGDSLFTSLSTGEGVEYEISGPCTLFLESSSKSRFIEGLARSPDLVRLLLDSPAGRALAKDEAEKLIAPLQKQVQEQAENLAQIAARISKAFDEATRSKL